jgi:hypothetical protein
MSWKDELLNIFLYEGGTKKIDPKKVAAMLGFGLSASGALAPKDPPVGYQGTVPKYNFVRNRVQNTYDPNRRPGSGGQRYFSTPQFVKQTDNMTGAQIGTYEDDLKAAQDAAATEVGGLETLNKDNLASYPAPVTTTPEETNTGIASLPSLPINVPTAEQQLTGQVNLGMADGGIVGLKKGTIGDFFSNLGSNIKNVASNITGVGNPANEGKSFIGADTWTYGANSEGEGGFTLQTPEAALASGDLDQDIYDMHTQTGKYENMRPDGTPRDSNDDKPNSNVYKRPADYSNFTAEQARELIKALAPTTKGYTGDYSDLDTFQSYYFSNPEFQFEDFKQLGEIAGYGKKNKLASDTNIISGAAEGTYRQEGDDNSAASNAVVNTGDDYEFVPVTTIDDQVNAITEYDQYVENQNIPIVNGFAVFDKNKHTMGGFDIGTGQSNSSTPVYVDDNGVVRYSNGQELNLPSSELEKIRNAAGYVSDGSAGTPISFDNFLTSIDRGLETYTGGATTTYTGLSDNVISFSNISGMDLSPTLVNNELLPITVFYGKEGSTEAKQNLVKVLEEAGTEDENGNIRIAQGPARNDDGTFKTDEDGNQIIEKIPQETVNAYLKWIDYLESLDSTLIEELINDLTLLRDFTGVTGTTGVSGAAYGGAIKGYAMGGMGEPPQGLSASPGLPAGLLKSTEDGMADTIPAQMGNQPINLSGGEYIMDAETVAFLGNGNTDAGAQKLDDFRETLRMAKNGGEDQGNQINSENFLGRLQQAGVA